MLLLQSQTLKDGTKPLAVTRVDDPDNAYGQLHQIMASAYANENVVTCLAQVMNENGTIAKTEWFDRTPAPEPEPEPELEP